MPVSDQKMCVSEVKKNTLNIISQISGFFDISSKEYVAELDQFIGIFLKIGINLQVSITWEIMIYEKSLVNGKLLYVIIPPLIRLPDGQQQIQG